MTKQKGITPIIAILVMLLITIAITGSAWIYVSSYYLTITGKAVEITSIDCTSSGVKFYLKNIGTETINTSADLDVSERIYISGSCAGTLSMSYNPVLVGPGAAVIGTESGCDTADTATVRYTIVVGGRVQKVQVTC